MSLMLFKNFFNKKKIGKNTKKKVLWGQKMILILYLN